MTQHAGEELLSTLIYCFHCEVTYLYSCLSDITCLTLIYVGDVRCYINALRDVYDAYIALLAS